MGKSCSCSRKSTSINGAIIKGRRGRTAEVDYMELGKAVLESGVGFAASNVVSSEVKKYVEKQGRTYNGTTSGLVKILAAAGTAWLSAKYGKNYRQDGVYLALGMGASGALDIAKDNVPSDSENSLLLTALGINGVLAVPPLGMERVRQLRLRNSATAATQTPKGTDLPYKVKEKQATY